MATMQKTKKTARRKAATKGRTRTKASKPGPNGNGRARAAAKPAEGLSLRGLMPTFTVNDLQKSISFYCDGLGFTVSERWEGGGVLRGVELKAGKTTFGLSQDDFAKGRDRVKGLGFRLYADTTQSVDALAKRLRAYGGKIVSEPADTPWGSRSFTTEDPDGFKISFSQPL